MREKPDPHPTAPEDDFAAQIRGAEASISRSKEAAVKAEAAGKPPFNWRSSFYAALLLASFVTMYRNLPEFMGTSFTQKPLRSGTYDTDKKTDLCILNLWATAAALRSGAVTPRLSCPASGAPYIIEKTLARCPNPGLHGAVKLYADKKNVMPFLEK